MMEVFFCVFISANGSVEKEWTRTDAETVEKGNVKAENENNCKGLIIGCLKFLIETFNAWNIETLKLFRTKNLKNF